MISEMKTPSQKAHTDVYSFVYAGVIVYVDVTDALAVAQNRNSLGRPLDFPNELGRTPWDDQVDQLVQSAQILHFFTCAHLHIREHVTMSPNHVKTGFQ